MNNNIVITISRQYGSGGRELSEYYLKKWSYIYMIDK